MTQVKNWNNNLLNFSNFKRPFQCDSISNTANIGLLTTFNTNRCYNLFDFGNIKMCKCK